VPYLETSVSGGSVYLWPNGSGEPRFDYERTCLGRNITPQGRSVRTSKPHQSLVILPLSQCSARAIQNGANALAEGFLFSVAAGLILSETYRSSRSNTKRREDVDDRIEDLEEQLVKAHTTIQRLEERVRSVEEQEDIESAKFVFQPIYLFIPRLMTGGGDPFASRSEELSRILSRIVDIGLRGGWAEFEDTPVPIPPGAHLQGSSQIIERVHPDAPGISEESSHSTRPTGSSAPIEQRNEQQVSTTHK
jgi:hypothetical protein